MSSDIFSVNSFGIDVPSNINTPSSLAQQIPKGVLHNASFLVHPCPSYSASKYQPASDEEDTFITYILDCLKAIILLPRDSTATKESPSLIPISRKYESGKVLNLFIGVY